jgi:hypothetical protein
MRSIKLVPALAATAALLAVAPAGAAPGKHLHAKRHARGLGSSTCRVSADAAPRFIEAGETAIVFGQLVCPGAPSVAGQTITVLQSTAGTPGSTTAGTTTTDPTGHYQLTTPALQRNSVFTAGAQGAKSGHRSVKVSPKVTLAGPPDGSQLFTGAGPFTHSRALNHGLRSTVTFTGTVSPVETGDVGDTVALQRENSVGVEEWRRIGQGTIAPDGSYSITHKFAVPGDANIRVVVREAKRNTRGASESLSYEISQAQNPDLTILSSADPISYGQPVTISGVISPAANTPLTLLARARTQSKFVPVATTTSNGAAYSFPVQTPLQSTIYEVSGGGKTSSRLFEGVKYGLTTAASASTVAQGQQLTFSGTVTPGHTGNGVYLQVQAPSGVGFHTVQVGKLTSGSTYSITYTPFNTGTKKFRIKIPGDPENQGVASPLMPVEITPAPASALTPEAPTNSSLPSEGHF